MTPTTPTSAAELLQQYARTRDAEAFAQLVERYQSLVFATCRRRLHTTADLDDAVQETFLRLATKSAEIRANLGAWLHTCAVNVATDLNRRRATTHRHERAVARPELTTDEAQRTLAELRDHLDAAMLRLDSDQRELIIQRFFEGRPQTEIAAAENVTPAAISRRLDRAIAALRDQIAQM